MYGRRFETKIGEMEFTIDSGASLKIINNDSYFESFTLLENLIRFQTAKKDAYQIAIKQETVRITSNNGIP